MDPSTRRTQKLKPRLPSKKSPLTTTTTTPRRASISTHTPSGAPKSQRTSKTSQKLVVLPSAPQTKPFDKSDDDLLLGVGYETGAGRVREVKNAAERMSKEDRKKEGFKRITAFCVAESFKMKLLASFLKREHNVGPRVFDEALYVMYHLPLLPGYGPNVNIRSSAPVKSMDAILTRLSEAEEIGYQGSYFPHEEEPSNHNDGYMTSSPTERRKNELPFSPSSAASDTVFVSDAETESEGFNVGSPTETIRRDFDMQTPRPGPPPAQQSATQQQQQQQQTQVQGTTTEQDSAEVVFFEYGVVVFFGLSEVQEKSVLEDIENAGIMKRKIPEDQWEVEECHFILDPNIAYPRIYNDFFTLKSPSHLLKLSIAHALAQSTLLAHFESNAQRVLSSPQTNSIPKQLAQLGALQLKRHEALKLTGRLFKLRQDVNLVSNVLDVPELFWSEASLGELYDAVREYMEIGGRVQVLNERLGVVSDFLEAIHDHLNNSAMERITWIIIWLIVAAILVELGEVIARLIVHATIGKDARVAIGVGKGVMQGMEREELLRVLERMSGGF